MKHADIKNTKRLHIGCGPVIIPGWLNVDLDHPEAQLHVNVVEGLPFPDRSADFIFAEHFIEHLSREHAQAFLADCHRVLVTGGVLRLSTPDLEWLVDAYFSRDTGRWGQLWQPRSPCRLINEAFHSWGHQFLYDRSEILDLLRSSGFHSNEFVEHSRSKYEELCGLESRPFNNELIIESMKTI